MSLLLLAELSSHLILVMENSCGSVRVGSDMAVRLALLSPVTSPKNIRTLEVMTSLQR
jgi:hypothetical protein